MKKACEYCGVEFNVRPCDLRRGRGKYCSCTCNALSNNNLAKEVAKDLRKEYTKEEKLEIAREALNKVDKVTVLVEVPSWLIAIRKSLKSSGKAYKYDGVGTPIGEYDWEGNLKEYV